jgi:hypothetical protein
VVGLPWGALTPSCATTFSRTGISRCLAASCCYPARLKNRLEVIPQPRLNASRRNCSARSIAKSSASDRRAVRLVHSDASVQTTQALKARRRARNAVSFWFVHSTGGDKSPSPIPGTQSAFSIRVHNEALTVAPMCVSNEDRSPFTIHGCNAAPTPTGCAEIVGDDLPASFHGCFSLQSFWKAGSERNGSQSGSSLRRAGVMGVAT